VAVIVDFYRSEPTARSSWRLAVLMGANSRTYKFALGGALLAKAHEGRDEVPLSELAVPYAKSLVDRLSAMPQAPEGTSIGETDFLAVAGREAAKTKDLGHPTEKLLDAAVKSMPAMVMQKFHNLRGGTEVAHRFYEVTGPARNRTVRLTPALHELASSEQHIGLGDELSARWSIVETSFAAGVGRSLIEEGVVADLGMLQLTDKRRRRAITGISPAVIGFQHGRCNTCHSTIAPDAAIAVDHVFPFALMERLGGPHGWAGPDLDSVWNLAPTHAACNAAKSDRLPNGQELERLALRNQAIMESPHPLKRTLQLALLKANFRSARSSDWPAFVRAVLNLLQG
jgi:5-methylcytosine-specific restriction endonuclease McrA